MFPIIGELFGDVNNFVCDLYEYIGDLHEYNGDVCDDIGELYEFFTCSIRQCSLLNLATCESRFNDPGIVENQVYLT